MCSVRTPTAVTTASICTWQSLLIARRHQQLTPTEAILNSASPSGGPNLLLLCKTFSGITITQALSLPPLFRGTTPLSKSTGRMHPSPRRHTFICSSETKTGCLCLSIVFVGKTYRFLEQVLQNKRVAPCEKVIRLKSTLHLAIITISLLFRSYLSTWNSTTG